MSEKMTPGMLRDLSELWQRWLNGDTHNYPMPTFLRDEAARREAGEIQRDPQEAEFGRLIEDGAKALGLEPAPPAADLVARQEKRTKLIAAALWWGPHDAADDKQPMDLDETLVACADMLKSDAAAIEALRAREKALEGALEVRAWTEEERDGMSAAFTNALSRRGHFESLFAVGAWLLRHRAALAARGADA